MTAANTDFGRHTGDNDRQATTISVLPDNVLLEIFCFYHEEDVNVDLDDPVWKWHLLVHVCQSWRRIVFASPHRLDLRIRCTIKTPVRKYLGIWPALPIAIDCTHYPIRWHGDHASKEENILTAIEHVDRVCVVRISVTASELEKISTVMQEPFPVLMDLRIVLEEDGNAAVLPANFLGGSAPRLQDIYLRGIPFPALPTLLLSTSGLVTLDIENIPPTGYISPEAIVAGLSTLPMLKLFICGFLSASPRPDRIHPPPITRTVLPALTYFEFKGASEYLEDLAARIDAPQLSRFNIYYYNQLVDFQVAHLSKFIDRSVGPKLTQFRFAQVTFDSSTVSFNTYSHANDPRPAPPSATTTILRKGVDWQVSHMAQVLSQFSAIFSNVVHLKLIAEDPDDPELEGTDVEWVHLLHPFSAVQTLHLSRILAGPVALALEAIPEEMVAEELPSLDFIHLQGQPASAVDKFVAARRSSDHPVAALDTEREFVERVESYVSK